MAVWLSAEESCGARGCAQMSEVRSSAGGKGGGMAGRKAVLVFCLIVGGVYSGLFLFYDGLRFPMIWDEVRFWRTTLLFSERLIPDVKLLKDYGQLSTPLP